MDPVVMQFAVALAVIVVIGTSLAGIHDAIARIVKRERAHRIRQTARNTLGSAIPLYRSRR